METKEGYIIRKGIESLLMKRSVINYVGLHLCLTFFSYLKKEWRDININLNRLYLMITNDDFLFDETYHLAIHSQNSLPNENDFIIIGHGTDNTIQYSEVRTQLLGTGFDTNCFDYDLDHKFANYNMRSDCITQCMLTLLEKRSKKFGNILPGQMIRKEFYQNKTDIRALFRFKYQDKFYLTSTAAEIDCLPECRKDCKFSYYISNYEKLGNFTRKKTRIQLLHSPMPDILITHLSEIPFNAFICNFGGLLGLWLGLSVFSIFSEFRDFCIKLFGKQQKTVNNYNLSFQKNSVTNNIMNVNKRKISKTSPIK